MSNTIQHYLQQVSLPDDYSHKGQNGKLLIIGGSELFHVASKWSLDIASKFVDMVFYASVPENNELIKTAKENFWNGIVINRENITEYIEEADAILIGPGMTRGNVQFAEEELPTLELPTTQQWNEDTEYVTNYLLQHFPDKKWVVDAGALQMVHPSLLTKKVIITPHQSELERVLSRMRSVVNEETARLQALLDKGVTVLLKGHTDFIYQHQDVIEITGGNAGMTKGGTGDVLAGLVAGLYATNEALTASVVASFTNKKAGEELAKTVGPFYNASDLVEMVPQVVWGEMKKAH